MQSTPPHSTVHPQPFIAVRDVRASSRWYRQLLALDSLPEHPHRDSYDRLLSARQLILQLVPPGHGVLIWFQVDDFDSVVERARVLRAQIILEPHFMQLIITWI